jgi:putative ribosome biogenesis GTPase RsgA
VKFPSIGDGIGAEPWPVYGAGADDTRRNAEQAVMVLVGHSGHGKSKTINRLIGQDILTVGQSTGGSTTKVSDFFHHRSHNQVYRSTAGHTTSDITRAH